MKIPAVLVFALAAGAWAQQAPDPLPDPRLAESVAGAQELKSSPQSPADLLEAGKNPGLGLRALHREGIDGRGIGIGIIDQRLDPNHREFAGRLAYYEDIGDFFPGVSMHGPAVASLAVGREVGVAPGASLYYVSTWLFPKDCVRTKPADECPITYVYYARALEKLVRLNGTLPAANKIRVVSISRGFMPSDAGYAEMMAALGRAKDAGIFVITTSLSRPQEYGWTFSGLGRLPGADPDDPRSYIPNSWQNADAQFGPERKLLVPMDDRTYASRQGTSSYEYGKDGGWSWVAPYLAGLYALACQVKPGVTPAEFWSTALATGDGKKMLVDGRDRTLATIVNPRRLLDRLKTGD